MSDRHRPERGLRVERTHPLDHSGKLRSKLINDPETENARQTWTREQLEIMNARFAKAMARERSRRDIV
jgi:hypothetical protein